MCFKKDVKLFTTSDGQEGKVLGCVNYDAEWQKTPAGKKELEAYKLEEAKIAAAKKAVAAAAAKIAAAKHAANVKAAAEKKIKDFDDKGWVKSEWIDAINLLIWPVTMWYCLFFEGSNYD